MYLRVLRRSVWVACLGFVSFEDAATCFALHVDGESLDAAAECDVCSEPLIAAVKTSALLQHKTSRSAPALRPLEAAEGDQKSSPAEPDALGDSVDFPGPAPSKDEIARPDGAKAMAPSLFQTLLVVDRSGRRRHLWATDVLTLCDVPFAGCALGCVLLVTLSGVLAATRLRGKGTAVAPSCAVASSHRGAGDSCGKALLKAANAEAEQPARGASASLFDAPLLDAFGLTPEADQPCGHLATRSIAAVQRDEQVAREGGLTSTGETGCAPPALSVEERRPDASSAAGCTTSRQ
eukprot:TRINITY_DN29708_c0_g1_i2.p1 TRINITY_DN29708_c0_g1~~TRINITY_DN29708_c0_g1_i2.p1  ORF type:complete len:293 (-),score=58.64 TRINITY_DN29708_c0_g1_i2:42-920(-)